MELIQALEQLSLEVRSQRVNISVFGQDKLGANFQDDQPNNSPQLWPCDELPNANRVWQYPPDVDGRLRNQLEDFENSIGTLLSQLSDLDCHEPNPKRISTCASARRAHFSNINASFRNEYSGGSIETSQEEDSDCSSQRSSSYTTSSAKFNASETPAVDPLVKDLLKRDLGAITDTVKKISKILTLGNEIETIYNQYFADISHSDESTQIAAKNRMLRKSRIDLPQTKSICDSYLSLCASEPYIKDLPTIARYSYHCNELLGRLDNLLLANDGAEVSIFKQPTIRGDVAQDPQMVHVKAEDQMNDDDDDDDDADDDVDDDAVNYYNDGEVVDETFLDCDRRRVDNWTENKLYVINQPRD